MGANKTSLAGWLFDKMAGILVLRHEEKLMTYASLSLSFIEGRLGGEWRNDERPMMMIARMTWLPRQRQPPSLICLSSILDRVQRLYG